MGQKINPLSVRLQQTNRYFDSCWYSNFYYSNLFEQELCIQIYLNSILKHIQFPTGRFFLQNRNGKIRIFIFFCHPLKGRRIRSYYFRRKFYKLSKKTKQKYGIQQLHLHLNNQIEKQIGLKGNLEVKASTILKNLEKKKELETALFQKYFSVFYGHPHKNEQYQTEIVKKNKLETRKSRKNSKEIQNQSMWLSINRTPIDRLILDKNMIKSLIALKKLSNFKKLQLLKPLDLKNNVFYKQTLFFPPLNLPFLKTKKVEKSGLYKNIPLETSNYTPFSKSNFKPSQTYRSHMEEVLRTTLSSSVFIQLGKSYDHFRSASFLAEEIVYYLEQRIPFRKIKNKLLWEIERYSKIKGIRITCSGRVGGRSKKAQRAKTDLVKYGETSLHVFSSRIDFAAKKALTSFGLVGVKVWISYSL